MRPWERLGEARTPDGATLKLLRHDQEYMILANDQPLMSSRMHGSEDALSTFGCERARLLEQPRVLVGGLGLGYTLRAALDLLPPAATIVVAELVPEVVEWNRGLLAHLADRPLDDPRVQVDMADVTTTLQANRDRFDAVLLDTDNGPSALMTPLNATLYSAQGIAWIHASLRAGGVLANWSAQEDRRFERRLREGGFRAEVRRVRARLQRGGNRHQITIAYRL